MTATLNPIDRIRKLAQQVGAEKSAAAGFKTAMEDPGKLEGSSTHPSDLPEEKGNERAPQTGFFAAENEKKLKEQTPNSIDAAADVTPSSAPKANEGRVDEAKDTGADPSIEDDYKDRPKEPSETSHPANASIGEKYSSINLQNIAGLSNDQLYKLAAELGNDIAADLANGKFAPIVPTSPAKSAAAAAKSAGEKPAAEKPASEKQAVKQTMYCNECHTTHEGESCPACAAKSAAAAGFQDAALAGMTPELQKKAIDLAAQVYTNAIRKADRVVAHLIETKRAEELEDPTGGSGEGEDHSEEGSEAQSDAPPSGSEGGEAPPPAEGGGDPMAAMGAPPAAGPDPLAALGGGAPPAGPAGPMGAPAMPGGGSGNIEQLLQALLMALSEMGMGTQDLGGMGPIGAKMAAEARTFQRAGKYQHKVASPEERKQVNYLKGYINELAKRSGK
jgi:hypothetical protein